MTLRPALFALALLCAFPVPSSFAQEPVLAEQAVGDLVLSDASARATLPGAPVGAGYLSIRNTGTTPDRLVSAASPLSGAVQIHQMRMEGDMMKMEELEGGLAILPGETVMLAPGGLHLMFLGLTGPFSEGASVPVTLRFERAGAVEVELPVAPIAHGAGHAH